MNRIRMFTLAVLIVITCHMAAQGRCKMPMTLHDCMEYAVSNSTKMRIEAANRDDERWLRRQAIMQLFTPNINAETYAYNQYGRNLDPETNTYNNVTTFYNGYSVNAGITLFDGFRSVNNLRMAQITAKMGMSKERQVRDEICLATMEAYCNVIYYAELEAVLREQVQTAQSARDKAVRQEELGEKGHADVMQMESELAQKRYYLITASNQMNDAMTALKDVMFWPIDDELMIERSIMEPVMVLASGSDLTEKAKMMLPQAEIAMMNRKRAEADLRMARGEYFPTLSFYGGWSTTYYTYPGKQDYATTPFREQFRNNAGEYLQLSLSVPIYDQLRRRTSLRQKKNALVRAQIEYEQTMRDIENEVARAINDRQGAEAAFRQADRLADAQKEAFRLSSKQYEAGLISALEYQTASQAYLQAMAERTGMLLKLRIKDSIVRYLKGEAYIEQ